MSENVVIEPATEADLDELSQMLGELFAQEAIFGLTKKQLRGLRLIFDNRAADAFCAATRRSHRWYDQFTLFTSGAEAAVILLEDLVVHKQYQGHSYDSKLLQHAIDFSRQKNFLRITLLTDRPENLAQEFFRRHGFHESSMIPMRLLITPEVEQGQTRA